MTRNGCINGQIAFYIWICYKVFANSMLIDDGEIKPMKRHDSMMKWNGDFRFE